MLFLQNMNAVTVMQQLWSSMPADEHEHFELVQKEQIILVEWNNLKMYYN